MKILTKKKVAKKNPFDRPQRKDGPPPARTNLLYLRPRVGDTVFTINRKREMTGIATIHLVRNVILKKPRPKGEGVTFGTAEVIVKESDGSFYEMRPDSGILILERAPNNNPKKVTKKKVAKKNPPASWWKKNMPDRIRGFRSSGLSAFESMMSNLQKRTLEWAYSDTMALGGEGDVLIPKTRVANLLGYRFNLVQCVDDTKPRKYRLTKAGMAMGEFLALRRKGEEWGSPSPWAKNPSKKKVAKKKVAKKPARKKTPEWQLLCNRCSKLWDHYCERPSKTRLKPVLEHLEKMKASTSKRVADERKACLRVANKEARRLKMK